MNTRFTVLIVLLATLPSNFAAAQQDWAKKLFVQSKHDFGPVGRGSKAEYQFKFKNTLDKEIVITKLRTSCGCTQPSIADGRVKPGEESAIIAKFNTESFTGLKSATITVVFEQPQFAEVQLSVTGYIRTDVVVNPVEANFGEFRDGESRPINMKISYAGDSDWQIKDIRSQFQFLQVALSKREKTTSGYSYQMSVGLKEGSPVGTFHERMTLVTNEKNLETVSIDVIGNVKPELILTPDSLNLGPVAKGGTVSKRLVLRGVTPFEVKSIKAKDLRFQFTKPAGKKPLHFISVNFSAGQVPGKISETIEITTDLKGGKSTECKVTGEVIGN